MTHGLVLHETALSEAGRTAYRDFDLAYDDGRTTAGRISVARSILADDDSEFCTIIYTDREEPLDHDHLVRPGGSPEALFDDFWVSRTVFRAFGEQARTALQ